MLRRIPFEKIENFRDLGGYSANYGETEFGVIYRSGSLSDATADDLKRIHEIGIKSVIDLRDQSNPRTLPDKTREDPSITHYLLPVNGNGRVPTSRKDMVNSYIEMLDDPAKARAVFYTLAHAKKPLVMHCSAGKDRTGCFLAVLLLANGVPFHDVNADYMLSFPYLTRLKRVTLQSCPDFPSPVLTPNTLFLKKVMDIFTKKWGTAHQYLGKIGLSEDDIVLLENLLGKQERSVGAVVFHNDMVLVEHMKKGHYSIPKGHVEPFDKDDEATALREIKEETDLDVRLISKDTHSIDFSPMEGHVKNVTFYIAESENDKTVPQASEIQGLYWLSPNDAIRTLTYDSDRQTVYWACHKRAEILYPAKDSK